MSFFEKIVSKIAQKSYSPKPQITQKDDSFLIENLPGNQTLELSLEDLRSGMLAQIADLLRPEDLAAILLMLSERAPSVLLAQAAGSIPEQVSNLQALATLVSGELTVQRAGLTFVLKVGDTVLAGDEVNADAKPVTTQLSAKNAEAGATVKFSGVVQFAFDNPIQSSLPKC